MFPATDNPARRLHHLLSAMQGRTSGPIRDVWASALGHDKNDTVAFYRSAAYLSELVQETSYRIRQLPDEDHDLYLEWVPDVLRAITPNALSEEWATYRGSLSTGQLVGVKHCASLLGKRHIEVAIETEKLEELSHQVEALIKKVQDAELNAGLKAYLYDLLVAVQLAIANYRFRGTEGLKKAIIQAYGVIQLNKKEFDEVKNDQTIKEIAVFLGYVVTIVTAAYKINELGGDMTKLLLP